MNYIFYITLLAILFFSCRYEHKQQMNFVIEHTLEGVWYGQEKYHILIIDSNNNFVEYGGEHYPEIRKPKFIAANTVSEDSTRLNIPREGYWFLDNDILYHIFQHYYDGTPNNFNSLKLLAFKKYDFSTIPKPASITCNDLESKKLLQEWLGNQHWKAYFWDSNDYLWLYSKNIDSNMNIHAYKKIHQDTFNKYDFKDIECTNTDRYPDPLCWLGNRWKFVKYNVSKFDEYLLLNIGDNNNNKEQRYFLLKRESASLISGFEFLLSGKTRAVTFEAAIDSFYVQSQNLILERDTTPNIDKTEWHKKMMHLFAEQKKQKYQYLYLSSFEEE